MAAESFVTDKEQKNEKGPPCKEKEQVPGSQDTL